MEPRHNTAENAQRVVVVSAQQVGFPEPLSECGNDLQAGFAAGQVIVGDQ